VRKMVDWLTWAYEILVGGLLITPGCINPIVTNSGFRVVIGIVSIVLGAACFSSQNRRKTFDGCAKELQQFFRAGGAASAQFIL
jgi:hypothetical protein